MLAGEMTKFGTCQVSTHSSMDRNACSPLAGSTPDLREALVIGVMSAHRQDNEIMRDMRNFSRDSKAETGLVRSSEKSNGSEG